METMLLEELVNRFKSPHKINDFVGCVFIERLCLIIKALTEIVEIREKSEFDNPV
jgi:hypothetical protein